MSRDNGIAPAQPARMATLVLTERRRSSAARWGVISGSTGIAANVVLVLFFAVAKPFSGSVGGYGWLGTLNDAMIAIQFAASIPLVGVARSWLPPTPAVRVAGWAGVLGMAATVVLQLLLVAGLVSFDVQVLLLIPALLLVFGWVLAASSEAHRGRLLPRRVTRLGLILGALLPLGLALAGSSLLVPAESPARVALWSPGLALGGLAWFTLPVWVLLVARQAVAARVLEGRKQ